MLFEKAELPGIRGGDHDRETLAEFSRRVVREFDASGLECAKVVFDEIGNLKGYSKPYARVSFDRAAKSRRGVRVIERNGDIYLIKTDKRKKV